MAKKGKSSIISGSKKVNVQNAANGVEFIRINNGATCPVCNLPKVQVLRTLPWEGETRIRYHCCQRCGNQFKSIEEN